MTGSNWRVRGIIAEYAAFVVAFACSTDASDYAGIEFTIRGNAGPSGQLVLQAQHAGNAPGSTERPGVATCSGNCASASTTIAVSSTETVVRLPWSAFTGGSPMASVDATQLAQIKWIFAWNSQMVPYSVDVVVDNLRFIAKTDVDGGATD